MAQLLFRFAPSPTGYLHLGHAYAALTNQNICRAHNGTMLLRMEDIDTIRCRDEYETAIVEDLQWLGFEWQGEIRRQSAHFDTYHNVLKCLLDQALAYPAELSRSEIKKKVERIKGSGEDWPIDPEGVPLYPGMERHIDTKTRAALRSKSQNFCVRFDIKSAMQHYSRTANKKLSWCEFSADDKKTDEISCDPIQWGDVILGRKDNMTSYHLACVIDDGLQGITHIVRGKDIYHATSIHRLLQELLDVTPPKYHHHELILDSGGNKLSKRDASTTIRELRRAGMKREELLTLIGLGS